jgi:hypothetical protein
VSELNDLNDAAMHSFPGDKMVTAKDLPVGKVRIRLSTLGSDRVYTNSYPLLVVTPQGVKKMGALSWQFGSHVPPL